MNKFTKIYNYLIENNVDSFTQEEINCRNIIYKFAIREDEIMLSREMAIEKAHHTMGASQAGIQRPTEQKINKAFQGVYAELAVHKFIHEILGLPYSNIKRYDIERSSFKYSPEEYDIKISKAGKELQCEVRSSISTYPISSTFNTLDIIGPYHNASKGNNEKISDFYIRPFFHTEKNFNIKTDDVYQSVKDGEMTVYILTGAVRDDFGNFGYVKTMGQRQTKYHAIRMKDLGGFENFISKFNEL